LRVIEKLRASRADLALSSDFIVGFPGENDEDFAATLRLVEQVEYAQAYSFKYSPRPGTPAAMMAQQVPDAVKAERLEQLQALLRRQQDAFNAAMVGRTLPVLFEKDGRYPGQLVGRSPYLQAVHAKAPGLKGEIAEVVIEAVHPNSLAGRLAHGAGQVPRAFAPREAALSA
jgi:tRNA-2-methylthio-N6-dimethylallyladenosine synthase